MFNVTKKRKFFTLKSTPSTLNNGVENTPTTSNKPLAMSDEKIEVVLKNSQTASTLTGTTKPKIINQKKQHQPKQIISENAIVEESNNVKSDDNEKWRVDFEYSPYATDDIDWIKVDVDPILAYKVGIRKTKSIIPNHDFTLFLIPDYDIKKKDISFNKFHTIRRKVFRINGEDESHDFFTCSCDTDWNSFISKMSSNVTSIPVAESECLHIKAASSIIAEMYRKLGEIGNKEEFEEELEIYLLDVDKSKLVVHFENSIGLVCKGSNNINCLVCSSSCCRHVKVVNDNRNTCPDVDKFFATDGEKRATYQRECFSRKKIAFQPSSDELNRLRELPSQYCLTNEEGALLLACEETTCQYCGNDLVGCNTVANGKPVFCRTYRYYAYIFGTLCSSCGKINDYEGGDDALLHMKDFLIHHSVLRQYMNFFLHGNSMTFTHFFNVWRQEMLMYYPDFQLTYVMLVQSWYCFLRLLDINLEEGMICQKCGPSPEIIICDGTTVGFQKKFLTSLLTRQDDEDGDIIPRASFHEKRIAVPDKNLRVKLREIVSRSMKPTELLQLVNELKNRREYNFLHQITRWLYLEYCSSGLGLSDIPKGVINLFKCLASDSPVCSYFDSSGCEEVMDDLIDGVQIKDDPIKFRHLNLTLPIVYDFLKDMPLESGLPEQLKGVFLHLREVSKEPFHVKIASSSTTSPASAFAEPELSFFPSLPIIRKRGLYELDTASSRRNSCKKNFSGHNKLMAGIFTVYCRHGICLGFSCMESAESSDIPFTILKTRWIKAPSVVIYDNSCSLHAYCLNRDPIFFKNTKFLVDRFHWKNHTACSRGYNVDSYPQYSALNTEVNEQQNASTKNITKQVSYMTKEHFMAHVVFFLWFKNHEKRNKYF